MRCDPCGSVMWDPLKQANGREPTCPTCGEPMKPERRRPGRKVRAADAERRELAVAGPPVETLR